MNRTLAIIASSILTPGAVYWLGQTNPPQNSSQSQTAPSARQSAAPQNQSQNQNQNQNQNRPTGRRDQDVRDQQSGQNAGAGTDNRNSRRTNNQRDQRDDNNMNRTNDRHFIALIAAQHQLQVHLGQIGEERASNDSVRQFAGRMVQEHSEFLNRLASVVSTDTTDDTTTPTDPDTTNPNPPFDAPSRPGAPPQLRRPDGSTRPNPADRKDSAPRQNQDQRPPQSAAPSEFVPSFASLHQPVSFAPTALQRQNSAQDKKPAADQRNPLVTPGLAPGRSPTDQGNRNSGQNSNRRNTNNTGTLNDNRFSSNNPVVQALQQVANRRFALAQSELGNLTGDNFDRAFMQLEVALHIDLVASQSALASVSKSQQFQQILEEGLHMDDEHLGEARRIVAQLTGTDTVDPVTDTGTGTSPAAPFLRRPQSGDRPSTNDQAPGTNRSRRP